MKKAKSPAYKDLGVWKPKNQADTSPQLTLMPINPHSRIFGQFRAIPTSFNIADRSKNNGSTNLWVEYKTIAPVSTDAKDNKSEFHLIMIRFLFTIYSPLSKIKRQPFRIPYFYSIGSSKVVSSSTGIFSTAVMKSSSILYT